MLQFVIIEAMDAGKIPNQDVGWWGDEVNGVRAIHVATLPRPTWSLLIAIHELVEQQRCIEHGITAAEVDAWDAAGHPADVPCPYASEHADATAVEYAAAAAFGVDWDEYNLFLEQIYGQH
jgi:hypothetical protein